MAVFVAFLMLASPFVAMAATEPQPEIWPSKEAYVDGEQVVIYGMNWAPDVSVDISLSHPDFFMPIQYSVMAGYDGAFTFSDYYASGVVQFEVPVVVTATQALADGTVLTATCEFLDPAVWFEGYTLKPKTGWTTGVLKGYNEGDSVPYQVTLSKKFFPSGTAIVQMAHDTLSDTRDIHGVDFLTDFPGTSPPFNIYGYSSTPFEVTEGHADGAVITDQHVVYEGTDKFNNRFGVYLLVWEFTVDFGDAASVTVSWGAHLALTSLAAEYYGASYWPGASLHGEIFEMVPEPDSGDRDIPIDVLGALVPPEMTLDKTGDKEVLVAGETITFTIEWSNIGQAPASDVTIVDEVPLELSIDADSFLYWTSAPTTPVQVHPDIAGNVITYEVGTWPGMGADYATPALTGYLSFEATVVSPVPGCCYENEVWLSFTDDHGGYYDDLYASWPFCIVAEPDIEVTKSSVEYAHLGDTITYTYYVENTGDVDLTVDVVDDVMGVIATDVFIAAGGSATLTKDFKISSIPEGYEIDNTVTVTGEDDYGQTATATDDWTVTVLVPELEVSKTADLECAKAGETVWYTIEYFNPSFHTVLYDVEVYDALLGSWYIGTLMPRQGDEIVISMPAVENDPDPDGEMVNTVEAWGFDLLGLRVDASDDFVIDIYHPMIEVTKEADLRCAEPGETVTYTIYVRNPTADTPMYAEVWDLMIDPADPLFYGWLNPGQEVWVGDFEVEVPVGVELLENTAYVDAWDPQEHYAYDEASWSVEIFHPAIEIEKWSDWVCAEEGETVLYFIEVSNPSHDATMDATVWDLMLSPDPLWAGQLAPGGSHLIGPLEYVVPKDCEWVRNMAYVWAYDHQQHDAYDEAVWDIEIFHPAIEIEKWSSPAGCAHVGEEVEYFIEVYNPSGDATMYVEVFDVMFGLDALFKGYLAPGMSYLIDELYYIVPEGVEWVENLAYVDAWDHQEHYRYAEATWSIEVLKPGIEVTKEGPEEAAVGETITYYVNVTNTGDTELHDVYVVDSLMGVLTSSVTLGIGETLELTYTYVVPAGLGTLDNYVRADGRDRQDIWVWDDDTWSVFKFGQINGFKVANLDGDEFWDDGEPGVQNWVISLYGELDDGGTFSDTRITDGSGYYEFLGLKAGVYTVSEVLQSGWTPVWDTSHQVTVGSGSIFTRNFGNMPIGSISGYKWLDADMDQYWDMGEDPIPAWTIHLDGTDSTGAEVHLTTVTDADGYYCFCDLLPGVYTVSEELPAGWIAVTPTSVLIDVSIGEPFEVVDINFGNVKFGSICGYKWLDEFMNGAWDYYEVGLPGWTIELTGVLADGTVFGPIYTLTDSSGKYCFDGLLPGTYVVREVIPDGWVAITPDRYEVTIDMGDHVFCAKFGNVQYGKIDGYKFLDWDMDGFFDGIEKGLEGWAITLEGWLNDGIPPMSYAGTYVGPFTIYTDENGYWCFDNLLPGVYRVTEESRDLWFNTTPLSRVYIVGSGTYVFDQKFGNVPYTCFNGYKFEDLNGNGEWDEGEPALPGWTVVVEGVRNDKVPVRIELVTDKDGYWATCFNMLPGDYVIYEVQQEGWVAVTPDSYQFRIPMCGEPMEYEFLFGNLRLGKICGYKYEDMNGNGVLDDGDVPIEGWEIYLSGAATATALTDAYGYFCFEGLMPGEYTVTEEERTGWVAMTPVSHTVTVLSGSHECVPVFLNVALSTVWGYKFEDLNSNGVWDKGEPAIEGWTIYLVWDDDPTTYHTYTDANGYYEFTGLMPDDYYFVFEEEREHWVPTTPPSEEFSLVSGSSHRVHDFGNFHCVWIEVFKYEDVDSNGQYDPRVDRPVEGWTFHLYDPTGLLVAVSETDESGYTGFWACRFGTWVVVEETRTGVTPINPASGWLDVEIWSGADPCPLMFGNFWDVWIEVFKYEDVNSNGQYDEGVDVPLEGWLIMLYSFSEDEWYYEYTDSYGMASFLLKHSDLVRIYEYLPEGWCQITPGGDGYYELEVWSGSTYDVLEFGNFECVWIDVFKYEDVNSNGVYDGCDTPIEGWYFYLYDPAGLLCGWAVTDASGHAGFWVCEAGVWKVVEEAREGVTPIDPACGWIEVEVWSGVELETLKFGNFWDVWIVVFKYEDMNSNGVYDDGDVPIEGWMFEISGPGVTNAVEYTDMYGYAYFLVNRAGTYTVTEEDRDGWTHVNPSDGDLDVTVSSGSQPATLKFGNFEDVLILIFKFDDRYADGQYCPDEGDVPIEGWEFELFKRAGDIWVRVDSGVTDEDGILVFVLKAAGDYMVSEVLQTGWFIVLPVGGYYVFAVSSGDGPLEFVFANFKLGKIFGYKWNDLDGDGEWDEGEPGLPGWTIWFYGWYLEGDVLYELWGSDTTDGDGYYEFTGLPPGTYLVWEVAPLSEPDWIPTSPDEVEVTVIGHTEARVDFFNFELGCVWGYKFEDMDGDGVLDRDDVALPGWYIYLYLGDKLVATAITDGDGYYSFCGLGPGTYTVLEETRTGWVATTDISETFMMTSGACVRIHDFLNFEMGEIVGWKFEDLNSNGVWDKGEPAIEGWRIYMVRDALPTVYTAYTDANGMFVFSGLMADYYMVWEDDVDGWTHTNIPSYTVDILSGSHIELCPFGNFRDVYIELFKYDDVNGNGVYDNGDVPIEGWEFTVTGPCFPTPLELYTDEYGYASFWVTVAGTYRMTEEDRDGWMHVNPASGYIEVEVMSGYNFATFRFGNFMLGEISGQKYYDWNLNGVWDDGEAGLANWVIWINGTLVGGGYLNFTRLTDSSGFYQVTGLPAGTYVVSERLEYSPAGWVPQTPTTVAVDITSGSAASVSFGNAVFGIIEGYKFYDKDMDGAWEGGEPGLAGWTIVLDGMTDEGVAVHLTTTTDSSGHYLFEDVQPGIYEVSEVLPANWAATTPLPVTVDASGIMEYFEVRVDIGNVRFGMIFGYKFQDTIPACYPWWPNGVFDDDEYGLPDWEITLQGWTETGEFVSEVRYTDEYGYYEFAEVLPGTYWVNETMLWGWYASTPFANLVMIPAYPYGVVEMRIDFGNVLPEPDPEVPFFLEAGWNLWSTPIVVDGLTAGGLLAAIGPNGLAVSMWDVAKAKYVTYMAGMASERDFAVVSGVGYFVYVSADSYFVLRGGFESDPRTSLVEGWNLIGYSSLRPAMASELLTMVEGSTALAVTHFDEDSGRYVTYIYGSAPERDFLVTPGNAYYIWVGGPCEIVFS